MPSELCSVNGVCELGAVGYNQAGLVLEGQAAGDGSGWSVSGVGDVNGDGVDDLMVGAYGADPVGGRWGAGKSYVVFGSVNGTTWSSATLALADVGGSVPGLVFEGQVADDFSGNSVSGVGDVNGDGVDDLMVGAYGADPGGRSLAGKSYVVFGSVNGTAWGSGTLALADVGGAVPGLVLEGEVAHDLSGYSVSGVGDVNGDGVDDLMVGASQASPGGRSVAGKSYVVFGSLGGAVWSSGTLALADVGGGVPGLVLEGQAADDGSGYSVSGAGDVNGDGVDDLMVGAYRASPGGRSLAGKSYVVFGSVNGTAWGNGTLALSDVGGAVPGVVFEGQEAGDKSGWSVSGVGDVNGDGVDDLMVGASAAYAGGRWGAGKSYVVFGSLNGTAWSSGTLALADVGGAVPGLVLEGEWAGDGSGNSVSGVGDVNGDGVDDLMVGANVADPGSRYEAGKSYVVFGSVNSAAWSSGTLALADVGGSVPGLVFEGQAVRDRSGMSVSGVGDVNGDGVDDLMVGAYLADPGGRSAAGKSYVVFGGDDSIEILVNQLRIAAGQQLILDETHLLAISRFTDNATLPFTVLDMVNARFEKTDAAGISITEFTQAELTAGNIRFVHEGSSVAPDYTICVYPDRFYGACSTPDITFLGIIPTLLSNTLSVNQGLPVILTGTDLSATDQDNAPNTLNYQITQITFGHFDALDTLGEVTDTNITTFTQQDVLDRHIRFAPDGSAGMPAYLVSVGDQNFFTEPQAAFISFNRAPVMTLTNFVIDQGQGTLITNQMLSATDLETLDINLAFQVSNVTQGQFAYVNNPGSELVEFPQFSIMQGSIHFVHSGTEALPTFAFSANDGAVSIDPRMPTITLNHRPIVRIGSSLPNQRVNQGEAFAVTVDTTIFDEPDGELLRFSANLQGGAALSDRGLSFTNNTLSGTLHTLTPVSIEVIASDPRDLTVSTTFDIAIDATDALSVNTLSLNQGQSVVLTTDNLNAQSTEEAVFQVSNLQHGRFERLDSAGLLVEAGIVTFTLQEIANGRIRFTHDGSDLPAAYDIALGDGQVFAQAQSAGILFNKAPILTLRPEIVLDQGVATQVTSDLFSATDEASSLVDLLFEVRNVTQGYFAYSSAGFGITEFPQLPVMQGGVEFVHDSSEQVPGFSVRVTDGAVWSNWQVANITLNHQPVLLGDFSSQLVKQYEPFNFTISPASFTDIDGDSLTLKAMLFGAVPLPKTVTFNAQSGMFTGVFQTQSTQTIEVTATDSRGLAVNGLFDVTVQASDADTLLTNTLSVNQGQSVILTSDDLSAQSTEISESLVFRVSNIEHGQFQRLNAAGQMLTSDITSFTPQEIDNGRIRFTHDGSDLPAAYDIALGDGQVFAQAQSAGILFNKAPILTLNPQVILDQGSETNSTFTKITTDLLSATDEATPLGDLRFEVRNITHGRFAYSSAGFGITEFPQLPVMQGSVEFIHDGSDQVPGFSVRVSDGIIWSSWQSAAVTLNHQPLTTGTLPDQTVIQNEAFSIKINQAVFSDADGDPLTLSATLLGGVPLPKNLRFNPITAILSGTIAQVSKQTIEVNARDPRGLLASSSFLLQSNLTLLNQLQNLWESVGVFFGVLATVGGFLVWRQRSLDYRQGHQFASLLRKRLGLEYYDFSRLQGGVYKDKMNQMLSYIDGAYEGFYSRLTHADKPEFIDCIARVMESKEGLMKPSGCFSIMINALLFFRCRRVREFNFDRLASLIPEIIDEAVVDWRARKTQWNADWNQLDCDERLFACLCCHRDPVESAALDTSAPTKDIEMMQQTLTDEDMEEAVAARGILR